MICEVFFVDQELRMSSLAREENHEMFQAVDDYWNHCFAVYLHSGA